MSRISLLSSVVLFLFVFSSCSKKLSVFDQRMQENNNWSQEDLKQIQFYLSEDISLKRISSSGTSQIENGKVKVERGRDVDQVVIDRGTPGVLLFSPKENKLAISFDADDDSKYLMFGPHPKLKGQYVVLASKWKGRRAIVTYGGEKYRLVGSPYTKLLLDIKKIDKSTISSKRAKGREVK